MTLLHYELPGQGEVHGHAFRDHFAEIPAHLVPELLTDPRWREATAEEQAAHTAPTRKPASKKG